VAVHDGEIRTQEGHGKFVAREPNGTVNKALSTWKELTAPTPVERTGIPATGVQVRALKTAWVSNRYLRGDLHATRASPWAQCDPDGAARDDGSRHEQRLAGRTRASPPRAR
jgi:hypothetical protein